jgi:small subunit ribosomal protein S18
MANGRGGRFGKRSAKPAKKKRKLIQTRSPFMDRRKNWEGPIVDYKEVDLLRKFLTPSGKMVSRKRAGTDAMEQREVRRAVKRARFMALLPYVGA